MHETIKEYLTFSKKERTGILILLSIVLIIAVAPAFYSSKDVGFDDSSALHEFKDQIAVLDATDNYGNGVDSISSSLPDKYRNGKYPDDSKYKEKKAVMFDFDPNTIPASGWIQLGISERTAITIDKYRSKGGKFRKAEDLLRIYGLSEDDKRRLLPFVKIANRDTARNTSKQNPDKQNSRVATVYNNQAVLNGQQFKRKVPEIIDINSADTTGWSSLPGIGPVLSQRIIKYRDRLGGFYSVEQVAEVYGLQDSVYQKIRPFLTRATAVRKINVNVATPDILEQHPYLKRQLARAIVDYRSQHGVFKEIGELKQVVSLTPELFDRISPYIGL